jgi:hypothetical protein
LILTKITVKVKAEAGHVVSYIHVIIYIDYIMNNLIYDIFIKNNYIYIISTFKHLSQKPLKITVNETLLNAHSSTEAFPMLYYSAKLIDNDTNTNTNTADFVININSQVTKLGIEYITPKPIRNKLAFATLFKDDHPFLPQMINHYRNQGVDCFYLYYNGPKLPNNLPQGPDINYYLWDIQPYFWPNKNNEFNHRLHNAQTSFLTMIQHKYFDDNEWIILADLDELIINKKPQEKTILDRLQQADAEVEAVSIRNHWAKIDKTGKIYYATKDLGPINRTKCIYRGSYKGWICVHHPFGAVNKVDMTDLRMLHVVNVLHNDRLKYVVAPLLTFPEEATTPPITVQSLQASASTHTRTRAPPIRRVVNRAQARTQPTRNRIPIRSRPHRIRVATVRTTCQRPVRRAPVRKIRARPQGQVRRRARVRVRA